MLGLKHVAPATACVAVVPLFAVLAERLACCSVCHLNSLHVLVNSVCFDGKLPSGAFPPKTVTTALSLVGFRVSDVLRLGAEKSKIEPRP